MAEYLLRNSLNNNKVVSCTITFRQIINKNNNGELLWLIEIRTNEPHKDGGKISPVYINCTFESNLDEEIKKATEIISEQVDWNINSEDLRPPFISYSNIRNNDVVSINSSVIVDIEDIFPAAGIDIDSIEMTVNGSNVTNDLNIDGDPYKYRVVWQPTIRVFEEE